MNIDCKSEIVADVLKTLKFSTNINGYSSIHFILSKAWAERDDDWIKYKKYIPMIVSGKENSGIIVAHMNQSIKYIWRLVSGNREILKCMFGYAPDSTNQPTWILFMRTTLAILFYCEDNDIDVISFFDGMKNPTYNNDENYNKYLAGYMIALLRKIELSDTIIDKTTTFLDDIIQNNSFGEAFITYIKYSSLFFSAVAFDDIVIPPECYNINIRDLSYGDNGTETKISNIFLRNGIRCLKDLRYYSSDDVKGFRNLGFNIYNSFIGVLKQTIKDTPQDINYSHDCVAVE